MGGLRQNLEITSSHSQSGILFNYLHPALHLCGKDKQRRPQRNTSTRISKQEKNLSLLFLTVHSLPHWGQRLPGVCWVGGCSTAPLSSPQHQAGAQLRTNFPVPTKRYHSVKQALSTNSRLNPKKGLAKRGGHQVLLGGKTDVTKKWGSGIRPQVPIRATNRDSPLGEEGPQQVEAPTPPTPLGGPSTGTGSCHPGEQSFHQEGTPSSEFPTP